MFHTSQPLTLLPIQEIGLITPLHTVGALSLDSQPLKYSLRNEATQWKAHFSKNIHKKAADDLRVSPSASNALHPIRILPRDCPTKSGACPAGL